jgi:hypothetical protein
MKVDWACLAVSVRLSLATREYARRLRQRRCSSCRGRRRMQRDDDRWDFRVYLSCLALSSTLYVTLVVLF